AEVWLSPVKDGSFADESDVAGHQADHRFVAIDFAQRAGNHRQSQGKADREQDSQAQGERVLPQQPGAHPSSSPVDVSRSLPSARRTRSEPSGAAPRTTTSASWPRSNNRT